MYELSSAWYSVNGENGLSSARLYKSAWFSISRVRRQKNAPLFWFALDNVHYWQKRP